MKYLIDFECAHWCGGQAHVVVIANSENEALDRAEEYMEEYQRELFSDEYEEEPADDECAYSVNSIEEFTPNHEYWKFYIDPTQSEFFPEI